MDEVRMATRDASWYRKPDTTAPKVYHVVVSPPYVAACNAMVLLDEASEVSLEAAHPGLRCRNRGCKKLWTEAEAAGLDRGETADAP